MSPVHSLEIKVELVFDDITKKLHFFIMAEFTIFPRYDIADKVAFIEFHHITHIPW